MTYIACSRVGSNDGNRKKKLTIPIGEEELFPDGSPIKASDKAHGFRVNGQTIWLPKSQTEEFSYKDGSISCWCPTWLIEAKSLELFVDTSYEPSLFGMTEEELRNDLS